MAQIFKIKCDGCSRMCKATPVAVEFLLFWEKIGDGKRANEVAEGKAVLIGCPKRKQFAAFPFI